MLDAALADSEQAGCRRSRSRPRRAGCSPARSHPRARARSSRSARSAATARSGLRGRWPPADSCELELEEAYARVAAANIARAGLADLVEISVGPAIASLRELAAYGPSPSTWSFIDADKASTPEYFSAALELCAPGGVIVADNVVRGGALAIPTARTRGRRGCAAFTSWSQRSLASSATTIQTVGRQGLRRLHARPDPGLTYSPRPMAGELKLGLNTGYWAGGPPPGVDEAIAEAERLGFDSIWTAEAYGSDCLTPLAWWGAQTERHQARHGDRADVRAPAGGDGDGGDDDGPPLGRALHPRPRRLRAAGRRGLVRHAVREAARAHARVHRRSCATSGRARAR